MSGQRMRDRAPGAAVMEQVVRLHSAAPPRSPMARALGRPPLSPAVEPWFLGALGEREVGAALDRLPHGWTAFHAVPLGSGAADADHLVVGPGGVFVVNTKRHPGARLAIYERSILVDGAKKPYLRNADLEASRVRGLLIRAGIEAPVRPVVAVVGAKELKTYHRPLRATIVRSEQLVRWLGRRPAVLDADTVARAAALFDDPGSWRTVDAVGDVAERFGAIEREVRSARLVRAGWALAGGLGIIAVTLPFVPH